MRTERRKICGFNLLFFIRFWSSTCTLLAVYRGPWFRCGDNTLKFPLVNVSNLRRRRTIQVFDNPVDVNVRNLCLFSVTRHSEPTFWTMVYQFKWTYSVIHLDLIQQSCRSFGSDYEFWSKTMLGANRGDFTAYSSACQCAFIYSLLKLLWRTNRRTLP